jgi:hypothetical protein
MILGRDEKKVLEFHIRVAGRGSNSHGWKFLEEQERGDLELYCCKMNSQACCRLSVSTLRVR